LYLSEEGGPLVTFSTLSIELLKLVGLDIIGKDWCYTVTE